jgi:3-phenylpropionate/trans-cinnamate dioxygenase ferredoxin subunit
VQHDELCYTQLEGPMTDSALRPEPAMTRGRAVHRHAMSETEATASGDDVAPEADEPRAEMITVCSVDDLPPGEAVRVAVDPPVAVFHTEDGGLYAVDDTCTHQDASLADGWLEGCTVECPLHASCFDLRTGRPSGPPATKPIRTYPVVVEDGVIRVAHGEVAR